MPAPPLNRKHLLDAEPHSRPASRPKLQALEENLLGSRTDVTIALPAQAGAAELGKPAPRVRAIQSAKGGQVYNASKKAKIGATFKRRLGENPEIARMDHDKLAADIIKHWTPGENKLSEFEERYLPNFLYNTRRSKGGKSVSWEEALSRLGRRPPSGFKRMVWSQEKDTDLTGLWEQAKRDRRCTKKQLSKIVKVAFDRRWGTDVSPEAIIAQRRVIEAVDALYERPGPKTAPPALDMPGEEVVQQALVKFVEEYNGNPAVPYLAELVRGRARATNGYTLVGLIHTKHIKTGSLLDGCLTANKELLPMEDEIIQFSAYHFPDQQEANAWHWKHVDGELGAIAADLEQVALPSLDRLVVAPSDVSPDGVGMTIEVHGAENSEQNSWFWVQANIAGIKGWCMVVGVSACLMGIGRLQPLKKGGQWLVGRQLFLTKGGKGKNGAKGGSVEIRYLLDGVPGVQQVVHRR